MRSQRERWTIGAMSVFVAISLALTVPNAAHAKNVPGQQGSQGSNEPVGPAGPVGPVGVMGSIGPAGPMGPVGPAGPVGPVGVMGSIGRAGPAGPAGVMGSIGPAGPAGPVGLMGSIGPAGPTGPSFTILSGGSGTDGCEPAVNMSVLDNDAIDELGVGRVLENDCNTLTARGPFAADVATPFSGAATCGGSSTPFHVQLTGAPTTGGWTFEVQKGGVDTGIGCSITAGTTSCKGTQTYTFMDGDLISIAVRPALPFGSTLPDDSIAVAGWSLGCN